jgi:replicative DNA helicase
MSTVEEEILSYIALTGELTTFLAAGVTADHFQDPVNRAVFDTVMTYKERYNEAPTPDVISRNYPNYQLVEEFSGPPDYLIDSLHRAARRTLLDLGVDAVAAALERDDVDGALALIHLTGQRAALTQVSAHDVDYSATAPQRLERYQAARGVDGGLLGIPTGFACLDTATNGIQKQQMIVLTGLAKSCKTTIMLVIAQAVYDHGLNPLIVSFEMPEPEISRRLDGFLAKINPSKLQTGQLTHSEWAQLEAALLHRDSTHPFIITEDRGSVMTLSGLQAKIDTLQPGALFVDGAYFLHDELSRETGTPLALTNISRGLKQLALRNDLPVIITTQSLPHKVGAKGLTAHSLGYTSAWVQDADVVIGTQSTEQSFFYLLKILASRNCPPQETLIAIHWDPPAIEEEQYAPDADLPY